jgi:hypothetical protein
MLFVCVFVAPLSTVEQACRVFRAWTFGFIACIQHNFIIESQDLFILRVFQTDISRTEIPV